MTKLVERFLFSTDKQDIPPRYNVAPTQGVLGVRAEEGGEREASVFRWGLIPAWAKEVKIGSRMINARAETVAEKPMFRTAFKRRRCLVLADGYLEWKRVGKKKIPHYYQMQDDEPFAFAGLWEGWTNRETGERIESCAVITTEANPMAALVHDRMPVILDDDAIKTWLDSSIEEREILEPLLQPFAQERMKETVVSTRVNNVRNDDPQCLDPEPFEEEE